jgi:hypothetical protein
MIEPVEDLSFDVGEEYIIDREWGRSRVEVVGIEERITGARQRTSWDPSLSDEKGSPPSTIHSVESDFVVKYKKYYELDSGPLKAAKVRELALDDFFSVLVGPVADVDGDAV